MRREVTAFTKALTTGIASATRTTDHDVEVSVNDANCVSAADLLRFHELSPERA